MASKRKRLAATWLLLSAAAAPGLADVFSSEFFSDPVSEDWEQLIYYCEPQTWNEEGWYYQQLDLDACPPGPGGGATRTAARLNLSTVQRSFSWSFVSRRTGTGRRFQVERPPLW
ncbi:MAG: hypothetical protein JSU86_15120 [Phycisphaerales bacterium]|nr:MAG: hypothetical protein JSU86_15120 [Phycisphaerales bacterium]